MASLGAFPSEEVGVAEVFPGVVQFTMQDRRHKNGFSPGLVAALGQAFARVRGDVRYRVVVLTGYDSYFCSGGTRDGLLMIQQGKASFTDHGLYSLPLDCEIPVVAAMQGHAIGGGLVFGLFADFAVFSRESVYSTNFMRYGFTPGMGATYILPKKFGLGLAQELLLSARNYRGADLEKRGIPFPVVSRAHVLEYAYELAKEIAEKPRAALVELKNQLVAGVRRALPQVIREEVAMHDRTFHDSQVAARIHEVFGR